MSDGDAKSLLIIGIALGGALVLGVVWFFAKSVWLIAWNVLANAFVYPMEGRLLRWLQDRATARAFGTSVEVVRIRRKADTGG